MRHIFPTNDTKKHYPTVFCECKPQVNEVTDVCQHVSFDGREIVLEAEVAMGMRCEDCLHYINQKGDRIDPPPKYDETA